MRACTISCLLLFLFIIPTIAPATVTFHNSCKYKVTLTGGTTKQTIKSGQVIKLKDIPDTFDLKVEMPKTSDGTPPTFSCHVDKVRDGSRYVILPAEYTNPVDILYGPGGQRTVLPQVMRFDQDGSKTWMCPTESERKALVNSRTSNSDTKIKDSITKQETEQQKVINKTIKKLAAKKEIAKLKGSSEQEPKKEAEKKAQEEKPAEEETVQEESEQVQEEETPAEPEAETESTEEEDVA